MQRSARDIFLEARQLTNAQRAIFLRGACGDDLGLRNKVEALLRADADQD